MPAIHPDIQTLRRLRPLSRFSEEQLQSLAVQIVIQTAENKEVLVKLGCTEDFSMYILKGEILTRARDGVTKKLIYREQDDLNPVAQLRPSMYEIYASGTVRYLKIDNKFLTEFANRISVGEDTMTVQILDDDVDTNPLMMNLY